MNVILIGMMASGKSTVAKELQKQGYCVVDTDQIITERYGDIPQIFAQQGESSFRQYEHAVIQECCQLQNYVISTGGGAILLDDNVRAIKSCGKVVYLRTREETIIRRLSKGTDRPLLQGDLQKKVHSILAERATRYEQVADLIIDTDEQTAQQIANQIKEQIQ